jgi:hypothetical protein
LEGFRGFLREHDLVQAQVSYQALQLVVLLLELPQPLQLRGAEAAVLLAPVVERGLGDAHLPAHLPNLRAQLDLLQR